MSNVLTFIDGNNVTIIANAVSESLTVFVPNGNTSVNGVMTTVAQSIAGVKTFTANTEFGGYVNVATTLQVTGVATLNIANITSTLQVAGLSSLGVVAEANTTVTGFVNVTSTLQVVGLSTLGIVTEANTTITGFANITNSLQVAGLSTLTGNTEVGGYVNVATTLRVAGTTIINGLTTANAALTVNGATIINSTLSANGSIGASYQVLTSNGGPAYWAPIRNIRWIGSVEYIDSHYNVAGVPGLQVLGWTAIGIGASSGSVSGVTDSFGYWGRWPMNPEGNPTYAFQQGGSPPWSYRCDQNPYHRWIIRTGPDLSSFRLWATLSDSSPWFAGESSITPGAAGDSMASLKGVGITFSTTRPDTGFRSWYSNGSVQTLGTVFVTIVPSTIYILELNVVAGICTCSVNGVTSSFTIPGSILATGLAPNLFVDNPDNSTVTTMDFKSMYGEHD
jgi:hypothetical protein